LLANEVGDDRQQFLNAITLLEQATRMDSTFALAYCQIAKADDWLYLENLDHSPERRTHGDAAVNAALRLKPNLAETNLTAAFHLYICYQDYQKARDYIAIAERALPNSADALALASYLDRRQGHWEESTKALEKAASLDPRDSEILFQLQGTYWYLRQYRACEKIFDRLIKLDPEKPGLKALKASVTFEKNADLTAYRAALDALPSWMRDNEVIFPLLVDALILSRDWMKAGELVRSNSNEELPYVLGAMVPRAFLEIQIAKYQGKNPEMNPQFVAARNQFLQKVEAHPEDPKLVSALGVVDSYLGRKQEALEEANRAVKMLPVSKDALDGPRLVDNLATVYAWTNEPDLALQALAVSVNTAGGVTYVDLKLSPDWDPLRADPRFDGLLAQLAPKD
jgi:tetratricopeptide (TPR) repeat protein